MNSPEREDLRKALLERCRTDPESVVDLVLDLMDKVEALTKRVEQLEDQLKKNSGNSLILLESLIQAHKTKLDLLEARLDIRITDEAQRRWRSNDPCFLPPLT